MIGDTASITDASGASFQGLPPAAKQAGAYVETPSAPACCRNRCPRRFRYRNLGNMATIGRHAGIADFGWITLRGYIAWWLWGIVHIFFLIDFRSRVVVSLNWAWSFLTYKRGARLITGSKRGTPAGQHQP